MHRDRKGSEQIANAKNDDDDDDDNNNNNNNTER